MTPPYLHPDRDWGWVDSEAQAPQPHFACHAVGRDTTRARGERWTRPGMRIRGDWRIESRSVCCSMGNLATLTPFRATRGEVVADPRVERSIIYI